MSRQQVQYLISEVALSTLANLTAISVATLIDTSRLQGMRLKQLKAAVSYKGKTVGEGPLMYGLCSQDLTNAEIAEALIADPQQIQDEPANEQGNRKVFPLGVIEAGLAADEANQPLRDVRYPWKMIEESQGIKFWVFNIDGNALTTGTEVTFTAAVVGEWLND